MARKDISAALQPVAERAERLGLRLEHFNSGSPLNSSNGTRFFRGTSPHDFFAGDHLTHCRTLGEAQAFLAGVEGARTADDAPAPVPFDPSGADYVAGVIALGAAQMLRERARLAREAGDARPPADVLEEIAAQIEAESTGG